MTQRLTNWHRAEVVAQVHMAGSSLAELARANNRRESALRMALTSPRTPSNKIIAAFLGLKTHEIWPEWFDDQGRRLIRSPKGKRARFRRSTQNGGKKLSLEDAA